jgi:hypothetical protein
LTGNFRQSFLFCHSPLWESSGEFYSTISIFISALPNQFKKSAIKNMIISEKLLSPKQLLLVLR